ncbi:MAG: hypothetical protein ACKPJH_19855 [Dolichospermum sp.]
MQITISPHLQSTYKLIQCAFPKGIEPQNYLPLLALLSEDRYSYLSIHSLKESGHELSI